MNRRRRATVTYDIDRLKVDMAGKGWIAQDLARAANVSHMTISRFLRGKGQTARTAQKLAMALGYQVKRYIGTRAEKAVA